MDDEGKAIVYSDPLEKTDALHEPATHIVVTSAVLDRSRALAEGNGAVEGVQLGQRHFLDLFGLAIDFQFGDACNMFGQGGAGILWLLELLFDEQGRGAGIELKLPVIDQGFPVAFLTGEYPLQRRL